MIIFESQAQFFVGGMGDMSNSQMTPTQLGWYEK